MPAKCCSIKGCLNIAAGGPKGGHKNAYCRKHLEEDSIYYPDLNCTECDKIAKYAPVHKKSEMAYTPKRCLDHKMEDDVNTLKYVGNGKCFYMECKNNAIYGYYQKYPTHCNEHRKHAFNVSNTTKCAICKKIRSTFGLQGAGNVMCRKCSVGYIGYIDVKNKTCIHRGCKKIPHFNKPGEKNRLYCSEHRPEGYIDVTNKTCIHQGCKKRPVFNKPGEKNGLYCSGHRPEGYVNVKDKTCIHQGCKKRQVFNKPGEKNGLYCSDHRPEGYVNVTNKTCLHRGCKKIPVFNKPGEKNGLYCSEHRPEGYVNVKNKICLHTNCNTCAWYGNGENRKQYCAQHADRSIHWVVNSCSKCRKPALYSDDGQFPFNHCENHAEMGQESMFQTNCVDCNLPYVLYGNDRCFYCSESLYRKQTEEAMKNLFEDNKWNTALEDRTIDSSCTRRRPDFVFDLTYGYLIVENDEYQHSKPGYDCETVRMKQIYFSANGLPVFFLRFNPHNYKNKDGKQGSVSLEKRHEFLTRYVSENIKLSPKTFFKKHPGLSTAYLYYDKFDECNIEITDIDPYN
jgi:hypothetical protein